MLPCKVLGRQTTLRDVEINLFGTKVRERVDDYHTTTNARGFRGRNCHSHIPHAVALRHMI